MVKSMTEGNELEQIRMRKIKAMLDAAAKPQLHVNKEPIALTDSTFSATVAQNELLVVDFWAPWCAPCRMVAPVLEELAAQYAGKVTFGKLNVDENQMVPSNFAVMSIPTIVVFHNGQAVERIVGAYPKSHIEAVFKRYIRSK
jgi:thioredoxin 1